MTGGPGIEPSTQNCRISTLTTAPCASLTLKPNAYFIEANFCIVLILESSVFRCMALLCMDYFCSGMIEDLHRTGIEMFFDCILKFSLKVFMHFDFHIHYLRLPVRQRGVRYLDQSGTILLPF